MLLVAAVELLFFCGCFVSSLQLQCTHEVGQRTLKVSSFFISATVNLDMQFFLASWHTFLTQDGFIHS